MSEVIAPRKLPLKDELMAELAAREASQTRLADFAQLNLGVIPAAHHRLICEALDDLLDDKYDELIINTPPGAAKALALHTPIPTPDGWTTMGDLRVGDVVFDENGVPCDVTWVSPVHRDRPVYSVTTDCGDTITADHDHEWLVRLCGKPKAKMKGIDRWGNITAPRSRDPVFKIKETHELHRRRAKRPMITRAKPLLLPSVDLPIDPYLLGVWLGDGTSSSMSITSSDEDRPWLRAELERLGYKTSDRSANFLFGVKGVRHLFTAFGLINDPHHNTYGRKHIPAIYLRASYHQRMALLQGLIDTDGTVCKRRGSSTFCNTNLELAGQVRELVRSLGVKAGWCESRSVLNGIDHGPAYRVEFYLEGSARMPRKALLTRNQQRTPNTYIDVLPAGRADTICIEVNSPSHLFLCGRSMTPTHNSTYTSIAFPAYYMAKNPTHHILTASYSSELAEKWGRRVRNIVSEPTFRANYGFGLSDDSKSAGRWANDRGGELYAAGVGSGILGFRADAAVLDDVIGSYEDAQSITYLNKLHAWYESDFMTRLKPNAKVVLICQRLARNDLAGYMIDRNVISATRRQRVLLLRMEAEEDDELGRPVGARLWPEWFTPAMVQDAKRDEYKWKTLYQQRPPSDDGAWVSSDDIQFRPSPPLTPDARIYGMTDLALSVNSGDYTAHIIVHVNALDEWDILDVRYGRVDPHQSSQDIIALCAVYKPVEWLIDDDNSSKVFGNLVATQARESRTAVPWRPMPMRGQNKETRAAPLRGQFKRRRVFMPANAPWVRQLTIELLAFPNAIGSGVDDGVDSLGLLGRRMTMLARPALTVVQARQPTTADMTLDALFEDMPRLGEKRI